MKTVKFITNHVIQGGEYNGVYHSGDVKEFPEELANYLIGIKAAIEDES